MKMLFLATAAALAFSAAPASAQLLGGGGGLGGTIGGGGSLGGLGGALDRAPTSTIDRVREPVTTTTRSTTRADGNARANSNVDRRSGRVTATGGADGGGSGTLDSAAGALGTTGSGTASGSGSGSAGGSANADLIGTDDVRSVAGSAANTARSAVGSTRELATGARNAVGGVGGTAGSVAGSGAAGGAASGTASNGPLALSGSSAADALGSFAVAPGMEVTDLKGRTIGTVRNLVTDARGRVEAVRMEVGKRLATVPAANFSGSGDVLVSAASKGEIKELAEDQSAD